MGFFSNINNSSKSIELENLLNQTMKATFDWEQNNNQNNTLFAATAIRNNTPRIVDLYADLVKSSKSRNIYVNNTSLPPPIPREFPVQMGIMAILDFANALGQSNPSFKNQLINNQTIGKIQDLLNPI